MQINRRNSQRGATAAIISISVLIITLAAVVGLQMNRPVTDETAAQETQRLSSASQIIIRRMAQVFELSSK